jgi:hypothetical protein
VEVLRLAGPGRDEGTQRDAEQAVDGMPDRFPPRQPVPGDAETDRDRADQRRPQVPHDVDDDEHRDRDARFHQPADPAQLLGHLLGEGRQDLVVQVRVIGAGCLVARVRHGRGASNS